MNTFNQNSFLFQCFVLFNVPVQFKMYSTSKNIIITCVVPLQLYSFIY